MGTGSVGRVRGGVPERVADQGCHLPLAPGQPIVAAEAAGQRAGVPGGEALRADQLKASHQSHLTSADDGGASYAGTAVDNRFGKEAMLDLSFRAVPEGARSDGLPFGWTHMSISGAPSLATHRTREASGCSYAGRMLRGCG